MWKSIVGGQELTFYLVGINNQNFIMADHQTGTWWQQVTGEAIRGPLAGQQLEPMPWDEVSFEIWRREKPWTQVYRGQEEHLDKYVLGLDAGEGDPGSRGSFPLLGLAEGTPLEGDTLVVGVELNGASKAYPMELLREQSPVSDLVGGREIVLWVAPDGTSVRAYERRIDDRTLELVRPAAAEEVVLAGIEVDAEQMPAPAGDVLLDAQTASTWNFAGVAISGPLVGKQLPRVTALKDYWFDWHHYHPQSAIYSGGQLGQGQGQGRGD